MKLKHSFKTAITGITTHKSRSALTLLGIVIGITSIILIISIGRGAERLILNEINSMGAETIVIRPGKEPTGPTDIIDTIFADSLKIKDIKALSNKSNAPHIESIAPAVIVPGSASYGGETYRPQIFGWSAEFMSEMFNVYPKRGVFFGENEIKNKASVVIIGSKVKNELFGESDALGKNIKIKGRKFKIIGIAAPRGQVAFFNPDEMILMPYSTAQKYILGVDYFHEIMVRVDNTKNIERTINDIKLTLRESHSISKSEKDDFFVVTQEGLVKQIETIMNILTIFLSSMVAIALIVGGIGVMNIMLVSVTERTKEIGLRKALGATKKAIMTQFILEAVILTAIGGVIGITLGMFLSFIVALFLTDFLMLNWDFIFPWQAALLGFSVSAFIGLLFGIYPAKKASNKSPMEALRYE